MKVWRFVRVLVFLGFAGAIIALQALIHVAPDVSLTTLLPSGLIPVYFLLALCLGGCRRPAGVQVCWLGLATSFAGLAAAIWWLPDALGLVDTGQSPLNSTDLPDRLLTVAPAIAVKFLLPIVAGLLCLASIAGVPPDEHPVGDELTAARRLTAGVADILSRSDLPPAVHRLLCDVRELVVQLETTEKQLGSFGTRIWSSCDEIDRLGSALSEAQQGARSLRDSTSDLETSVGEIRQVVEDFVAIARCRILQDAGRGRNADAS